ncbi:MAG: inorganic diphosphatase [Erysipelotrichaceae bacterium]|nr:inorganic diphosphatase [Erysipelotrichaceae bacterium]
MSEKIVVEALIEIPLNSFNKYEKDEETGKIKLDRVLYAAMRYPTEYGIIEDTLAPDGDPLDILVICTEPTFAGCIVPARVLGYLEMIDGGKLDYKLISVVDCDPRYDDIHTLDDIPTFKLREIQNFFDNYKVLQGVDVTTGDYHGIEDTKIIIQESIERYNNKHHS